MKSSTYMILMNNTIKLIQPDWPAPANIHACTTTRHGGVSLPPYASLNLASHVEDNPKSVRINRKRLADFLAVDLEGYWLQQTHSNNWLKAETLIQNNQGDASYTRKKGQVCCVLTADCVPVLFCNRQGSFVAAVHAGWQGIKRGIIKKIAQYYPQCNDLMAWIGPCIQQAHFEVGDDLYQHFMAQDQQWQAAFVKHEKWHFDLVKAAKIQLKQVGIEQVYGGNDCTWQQNNDFYSYRREGKTGRMASLIWIA